MLFFMAKRCSGSQNFNEQLCLNMLRQPCPDKSDIIVHYFCHLISEVFVISLTFGAPTFVEGKVIHFQGQLILWHQ